MKRIYYSIVSLLLLISTNALADIRVIQANNFFYSPASTTINLGDTIRFQWVAGTHPTQSTSWAWTTFTLSSTLTSFDFVPTAPGLYPYVCTLHASLGMDGDFTVISTTPPCGPTSPPLGLAAVPGTNSALVSWNALPNTQLYQVQGRPLGSTSFRKRTTTNNSVNVGGLMPATTYEWQVRALCTITDVITIWSPLSTFTTGTLRLEEAISKRPLTWTQVGSELQWQIMENTDGEGRVSLVDVLGREVSGASFVNSGEVTQGSLNVRHLTSGQYFLNVKTTSFQISESVYVYNH